MHLSDSLLNTMRLYDCQVLPGSACTSIKVERAIKPLLPRTLLHIGLKHII